MHARRWTFRIHGDTLEICGRDAGRADFGARVTPEEAAFAIETLSASGSSAGSVVASLTSALEYAGGRRPIGRTPALPALLGAVAEALRRERLIAYRTAQPTAVEQHRQIEVLGPEVNEEKPVDLFVLAAEVRIFGDTLLLDHPVRVLDPKTGEVVVDGLRTDDKGVVRTEVPENKTYRIEIVDLPTDFSAPYVEPDQPHARLRCEFVDASGEPLAGREVKLTFLHADDLEMTLVTDEDGVLDVLANLGPYTATIDDVTFDAHTVLQGDDDDDDAVYRFVVPSKDADEPADEPKNKLWRDYFDDDELAPSDELDALGGEVA